MQSLGLPRSCVKPESGVWLFIYREHFVFHRTYRKYTFLYYALVVSFFSFSFLARKGQRQCGWSLVFAGECTVHYFWRVRVPALSLPVLGGLRGHVVRARAALLTRTHRPRGDLTTGLTTLPSFWWGPPVAFMESKHVAMCNRLLFFFFQERKQ